MSLLDGNNQQLVALRKYLTRCQMPGLKEALTILHPLLIKYYLETATITDYARGYISFPPANQIFPGEVSAATGIVGLCLLRELSPEPTVLVGIPDSGRYYASNINALAPLWEMETLLVSSRSDGRIPGAWKNPVMVQPRTSFTTGRTHRQFAIHPAIRDCRSVVVIDDFCASGGMATVFIQRLKEEIGSRVVGFITLVEKVHQGGIQKVYESTGIPCAAVFSVETIEPTRVTKLRDGLHLIRADQ